MNANKKIHTLNLEQWAVRIQEQAASGLTVKQWCAQNNFTVHNYYYWKRILKDEHVDSILPEIVPVTQTDNTITCNVHNSCLSSPTDTIHNQALHDSHNLYNFSNNNIIHIVCGDSCIELCADVSYDVLSKVVKAVKYA